MAPDLAKNDYPLVISLPQPQFHGILDSLPDATLVTDSKGKILFASTQAENTFGYKPDELVGMTVEELMPESYRSQHLEHRQSYFRQPKYRNVSHDVKFFGQRKDGSIFPAEICLGYIQNGLDSLVISTIRDISERIRTEQLEIKDERFRQLLQHTPLAIALLDIDLNYLNVSKRWLDDFRLDEKDVIGFYHFDLFRENSKGWKNNFRRALAGEALQAEEELFKFPDGRTEWVRWQCRPWRDDNGKIGGILHFFQIISRRKHAEIRLDKSEEHLRKIYENAMTGIAMTDMKGVYQHCNFAYSNLLGYTLDELRQLKSMDLIHPDDLEANMAEIARLQTENLPYVDITNRYLKKSGEAVWVRKNITLLFDEYGQPEHYLAVVNDNTMLRTVEEALATSFENLEKQVIIRTQELEEAKRHAEDANAFKSRFLTAASHDLRQPLQSVELYLSVLGQMNASPEQQEIYGAMQQSLDAMCDMLDTLLDISKFQSGAITPNKQDFFLDMILNRIVTANLQQAQAKGLTLKYQAPCCWIHSDPALLERVIENFVTNAIRYTQEGHILIDCENNGIEASISVSDTGIGMHPSELDKIFNEYYQVGNPGRDRRKGLGVGLAIAKHIAQLLGHAIDVKSTPGQGSVFTITVPLGDGSKSCRTTLNSLTNSVDFEYKPEVLFIDDDPMIVKAMKLFFDKNGLPIYTAESGEDAIAQIQSGLRPDVIITDYRLPGCNGIDAVKQIRDLTLDMIPAIIVSGDTSMRQIEDGILPQCRVFMKPVDTKKMIAAIYDTTKILHTK